MPWSSTSVQRGVLAAGVVLVVAYALLPHSPATELVLYDGAVALALVAAAVGARRVPAGQRAPWLLTTLALAGFFVGELLWWWSANVGVDRFPSVADGFYLGAYLPLGLGAAALVSGRRAGRDRFAWLDATLLTVVLGVFVWVALMAPSVDDQALRWPAEAVSLGYPLADLFVLGFTLRLVLSRSAQTRLDMAGALGLKTVAEGVESADELAALDALDCSHAQGYLLGYPQDVEDIDQLVGGAAAGVAVG